MDALKFAEFFSLKYLPYGLKMLPWQYLDAARYCRYDFLWFCKTALWLEISIFSLNQSKWYENLLEFTSWGKYQVRKVSVILLVMTLVWFFMFFFRTAPWNGWSAGAEVWPLEVPDMKGSGISKNLSLRGLNKLRKEDQVFSVLDKNFIFYKMFFIFVSCYQSPPIFCWGLELGPADVFDKSTFGILGRHVRRFLGSNCQNSKV